MKPTKIIRYFLFFCFILLISGGCSNYNEINNVMIVDGMGIEKVNDQYVVSFNAYMGEDKYQVYDVTVSDLDNAFNDIYLLVNKKIYLSHLNILYLSSNLNNEDILSIINTFNKRDDLRGSFLVTMVNDYNNKIFMDTSISYLLENNHQESGIIYPTTFNDIISNYLDLDISYIPVINNTTSTIMGMHSIIAEYRFYDNNESSYLNLILDKSSSLVFDIDNDEVKLSNIDIDYEVNDNHILIDIKTLYISNLNKKEIETYLLDKINFLLDLDINKNYFLDLIKKKDYSYYNSNNSINLSIDINISLTKDELNNIKDGDLLEKDK